MIRFKDGQRIRIVHAPAGAEALIGQIGIARQPQGFGYEEDSVMVFSLDGPSLGFFDESQLEPVE